MRLLHNRLEKLNERGGKLIARCPACAELGKDRDADNLAIMRPGEEDEHFACAAYLGDTDHARRIIELVGDKGQKRDYSAPVYRAPSPAKEEPLPPLTERQIWIMRRAIETLGRSDQLCAAIARKRGWKAETLRHAAMDCSLGWIEFNNDIGKPDPACPDSAPCFIYRAGLKVRFTGPDGKKALRWLKSEGLNHKSLWRGEIITQDTRTIWITEGEPDALRLMDMVVGEQPGNGEVVTALPFAGYTLRRDEIELLRGREVVLVSDADDAGRASESRLKKTLAAEGMKISTVKL